ncbi:MAG: SH3 domain-containing protein [Lentisphaeria bacterium]|jgi:uncharacterized protein YgiM (DUF1202 family)
MKQVVTSLLLLSLLVGWGAGAQEAKKAVPTTPPAAAPAVPAVPVAAKVSTSSLNIRARPGLTYEVIGKFKLGDAVMVTGELDDWYAVQVPPTVDAWVSASFLDAAGKVMADQLKVRSGPGIVFNAYAMVKRGDPLKKIGDPSADGWQRIAAPAGATAWVSKRYVTLDNLAAAIPGVKETVSSIATPDEARAAAAPEGGDQTEAATAAPAPVPAPAPEKAPAATAAKPEAAMPAAKPAETGASPAVAVPAPAPVPGTAEGTPVPAAAVPAPAAIPATLRDGVLTALKEKATAAASHLLSTRAGDKLHPQCYLISGKLNLNDWEGKIVRVYGREVRYATWRLPVIEVTGIQSLE